MPNNGCEYRVDDTVYYYYQGFTCRGRIINVGAAYTIEPSDYVDDEVLVKYGNSNYHVVNENSIITNRDLHIPPAHVM